MLISRTASRKHLARLLELGGDLGHHAHGSDEGESRQDLCHPLTVHAEPVDFPIA